MAESSAVAFGRYLRTLRERRGHSLDDVESLSRAVPERIGKGYLSRCENGRQRLAFSKMITVCRVYDVPSEVLIERMELDLELDRVGGPETEGLEFEELTKRGKKAAARGAMWEAGEPCGRLTRTSAMQFHWRDLRNL
jgi:transcriptional regulator with XRE-family HTH domain